mmetsp:Transcript_20337/g.41884  ORF Transcript_20337/g.41884 Transcript_20337/m.41884 type:complete len:160 (-) Transcript_20337:54-533(-)|eukprot:CAMPEP_0197267120 /NCGR_PEP_ID=MMETSP1432-20130617/3408_1 /TAXON_ID=44447 /ORGANISM="Pseudo-nitzschia delicatissima, Strain UNC1205" /LENGTH=159 /DNA_ID=CAMNT_0042732049 /DNA_START=71 /DNA_END=550 /DNA_ORIENTATION=-
MSYNNSNQRNRAYQEGTSSEVGSNSRRGALTRRSPIEISMSLTDLLKDMEQERDITNSTECDISENSSFALDKLEADMQIGSIIRTKNLPSDSIGSSIHTEDLPKSFDRFGFMESFRKSQRVLLRNDSTISEKAKPENPERRKKIVRFESISKLSTLLI